MMNQWKDDIAKLRTSKRYIRKLCNGGLHSEGAYIMMNNNAATYFIVEEHLYYRGRFVVTSGNSGSC